MFHRYINMTYKFTKVQGIIISVEFANVCEETKLKHTLPEFKKADSAI